ncbi:MAG: alpha-glucosidase [Chloroflexi bacterium]|nr:alpha-glucosidase [Chloroflexota bacterium]MCI0577578.1 alpha-glucosidase [Chloroflexota bacterium]MCI0644202.1 alpha-glucosidase [Chloroflexota bacterium]MCI0725215.1 alpha-glucosidase [Chloroflexota bacterium]
MKKKWWKESVVYQIYPRSFYDSNGDGVGDLRGIIEKLDYLQELGVNVVWLSPVYQSPNDDNGYDISNYRAIMDEFGTLADWEEMLAGMHQRGIRLIMDLVVNHTSDEHPWFVESRKSKDNPYRDYYIWRPAKDGREPNNWFSFFSGSAWQYDQATDEYYLHLFSRKQPDLNWENPAVRREIYDMMHWWLQKGVDGFRMDVINMISKVPGLPDAPVTSNSRYQFGGRYFINGPRLAEFLQEMKDEVLSKYDIFTVGETPLVSPEDAVALTHEESGYLNMLFQFEHMEVDVDRGATTRLNLVPWRLSALKQVMTRWQKGLEGQSWNSLYLSNHDQPRQVSRFGDDGRYRVESAKLLATFLHMLQGTPYIYQGEEIGMTNVKFDSIEEYRDIETLNAYRELVEERGLDRQAVLAGIHAKSRDNARTPVQWDDGEQAGFTTGEPWIKINPNYRAINVRQALADPHSIFYYYQKLIRLRKENPVVVYGRYDLILEEDEAIVAFTRTLEGDRLLVILNFTAGGPVFELPGQISFAGQELLISNYEVDAAEPLHHLSLRPFEARVYRLSGA